MNGPHDLGGRSGFGPIFPEPDEPIFHADWEARALGLTLCCGLLGHWTLDESRHARENVPAPVYLTASYYEIWLRALEALLLRHGEVTLDELSTGQVHQPARRADRRASAAAIPEILAKGGPVDRSPATKPAFEPGDHVRLSSDWTPRHTRRPTYAMGKIGVVSAIRGHHVFPDTSAHGEGEQPCWLYAVTFDGNALWGAGAEPNTDVTIDAFERYLSHADT